MDKYKGKTQQQQVVQYMKDYGSITPVDAFHDLGITRLAARVNELRDKGIGIDTNNETSKNRWGGSVTYARYTLKNPGAV